MEVKPASSIDERPFVQIILTKTELEALMFLFRSGPPLVGKTRELYDGLYDFIQEIDEESEDCD